MARPEPEHVTRVALVGTGLIGAGWAALFLAHGKDVSATDPDPAVEGLLRQRVDRAWPVLEELGLAPGADRSRLSFFGDLESTLEGAGFVQESADDTEGLKVDLLARIDALLPADVVVASSTSSYLPTRLQSRCRHPGRIVVGHPFNPPYLVPLVEVVGGERTDPAAVDWAMAFYAAAGRYPVRLKREIFDHIANRFQKVLWNEAVRLVNEGVADVADVDAAVTYGPGLRWVHMGPILTRHLAGGEGGLARSLYEATRTGEAAPLRQEGDIGRTPISFEDRDRLVDGVNVEAGDRGIREIEEERDRVLAGVLKALALGRGG